MVNSRLARSNSSFFSNSQSRAGTETTSTHTHPCPTPPLPMMVPMHLNRRDTDLCSRLTLTDNPKVLATENTLTLTKGCRVPCLIGDARQADEGRVCVRVRVRTVRFSREQTVEHRCRSPAYHTGRRPASLLQSVMEPSDCQNLTSLESVPTQPKEFVKIHPPPKPTRYGMPRQDRPRSSI